MPDLIFLRKLSKMLKLFDKFQNAVKGREVNFIPVGV